MPSIWLVIISITGFALACLFMGIGIAIAIGPEETLTWIASDTFIDRLALFTMVSTALGAFLSALTAICMYLPPDNGATINNADR